MADAITNTTPALQPDLSQIPYSSQAVALAEIFRPLIEGHLKPAEANVQGAVSAVLAQDPELLQGYFTGTLYADTGDKQAQAAELAQVERELAEIEAKAKALREKKAELKKGENPEQGAVKTFIKAGIKAFNDPGSYVTTALPYASLGLKVPEAKVQRGRPAAATKAPEAPVPVPA